MTPITTADWLHYIESLGPADPQTLRLRLQAAGADAQRAEWIASLSRRRALARQAASIGAAIVVAGVIWCAYQWWLAINGAPDAPGLVSAAKSAILVIAGAFVVLIATATEVSGPIDLLAHPQVPASLPAPPRDVAMAASPAVFTRFALALAAMACGFLTLTLPQVRNHVWLQKHGVETIGEVTRKYTSKGSKGRTRYHFAYRFDRGEGRKSVRRPRYEAIREGERVPVTYLPDRPEISLPQSKAEVDSTSAFFGDDRQTAAVLPVLLLPLIALSIARKVRWRPRGVAAIGVPAIATVTRTLPQAVEYTFTTPDGAQQKGTYFHGKRKLRERPSEGQPLAVLYDPAKPKRSVLLGALADMTFSR